MRGQFTVCVSVVLLAFAFPQVSEKAEEKSSQGETLRVFPATRKGDFSRKLAIKIRETKACSGIIVTANKDQAEYTAMHGLTTSGWVVYRRTGDVVETGSTMLVKTLTREVCEAVRKDHLKNAKDREAR